MKVRFEPLDSNKHDRGAFSCGNDRLDRYLREIAAQASEHFRAQTFILVEDKVASGQLQPILGFYTLALHEYRDEEMDPATARKLKVKNLGRIPAVLLGQLAVAEDWQHKRLGPMILNHAVRRALLASYIVGGVMLITDPIDDNAIRFYTKYDFAQLPGSSRLYMSMKTIAKLHPDVVAQARTV